MLSTAHGASHITSALKNWLRINNEVVPNEVILDESDALMLSVVQSFAKLPSTHAYITLCMNSLLFNAEPPQCFIRLDRSHFVKSIIRNTKKGDKRKINLIRGTLGYLIQCADLKEAGNIIRQIFVFIRNPYYTDRVHKCKEDLLRLIKTHDALEEDNSELTQLNDSTDSFENIMDQPYRETLSYKWVINIVDSIETEDKGMAENVFYSPEYEKYLIHTFTRIPLWSNVLLAKFDKSSPIATSSASESEFKNVKRLLGIKTKRVDVFVERQMEFLSGKFKIALNKRSRSVENLVLEKTRSEMKRSLSADNEQEIEQNPEPCEGWRGKNSEPDGVRRSKGSILNCHDASYVFTHIPLLKNGYRSNKIITTHTCPFDSIYAVAATAFIDYCQINEAFKIAADNNAEFSSFVINVFQCADKKFKAVYEERNRILQNLFLHVDSKRVVTTGQQACIDCKAGIGSMFAQIILRSEPHLASYLLKTNCSVCEFKSQRVCPFVPLASGNINLSSITPHIRIGAGTKFCEECHNKLIKTFEFQNIITFEVEPSSAEHVKFKPSEIQSVITIENNTYELFGMIEYDPALEHFVAHVKRKSNYWYTFDDLANRVHGFNFNNKGQIEVFMLFYVASKLK